MVVFVLSRYWLLDGLRARTNKMSEKFPPIFESIKPETPPQSTLREVAEDWTWKWEWAGPEDWVVVSFLLRR